MNHNLQSYSHAVCRSAELLSCAKTAVKIAQTRMHQNGSNVRPSNGSDWVGDIIPSDLELHNNNKHHRYSPLNETLYDGLEILDLMESELKRLNELVRRRGHSNDPTQEISVSVAAIEKDVAELTSIVQAMESKGIVGLLKNQQRQRHIKVIQEWFQTMIQHYATQLKDVLSVRATVLSDQARRRGMFQPNMNPVTNSSSVLSTMNTGSAYSCTGNNFSVTNEAQNALFAPLPPRSNKQRTYSLYKQEPTIPHGETTQEQHKTLASNGHLRRAGGYGGGGDGSTYSIQSNGIENDSTSTETGMRRRKQQYSTSLNEGANTYETNPAGTQKQHYTVYETQQQNRQTAARLKEARQAEQSLAALGTIFGKMSTLIVQQSETLSKIEDDVEAANVDVNDGHDEITNLYSIKKGNRMLIIKVYSLLIFLIVFMKIYAKK